MPNCKTCKSNCNCKGVDMDIDCEKYTENQPESEQKQEPIIPKIPIIQLDQTKPLPGREWKSRVLSVGRAHMVKLLALANAQAAYITKEDLIRQMIDEKYDELASIPDKHEILYNPKTGDFTQGNSLNSAPKPSPRADTFEA